MSSAAVAAVVLGVSAVAGSAVAPAEAPGPPFVNRVEWVRWDTVPSLRVYPTPSGRAAAAEPDTALRATQAWNEVLMLAPDADTPGMQDQFRCHWEFAELTRPGKTSWNLEPWRPVVDGATMLAAGCNPGGGEEPF